ncbi:MAG TPA: hypothetical protein VHK69_17735, partial [Chitinophagaceae bacterium]|nr:hypothetical protein [Chitinophagaceae bacterium]
MEESKKDEVVPEQQSGAQTNTEEQVTLAGEAEARAFFQTVRSRLLSVNDWHRLAGALTADFVLTDERGHEVDRPVQEGDHFKIDIPGPGPVTGEGYDWVQVESVTEKQEGNREEIAVRVRPATNPTNDRSDIAHFFDADATSCFMAIREGNTVTAAVYGRNEHPNTHTETVTDKARNAAVA